MPLKREIYIRVTEAAEYIRATGATVRVCAKRFGVSKTTIHKDMRERLKEISPALYEEVARVLAKNKAERHIRGGEATREKYQKTSQGA
ncbi:MAG TPA: sporulation transcriptional regulator SpoIIID [Candidatus Alectryocaccomicrobium excrementavium]|uniref:Sporulation transcriptional regulator SpoIIID n=1 Tax=Candidatus Alectryocaccomicrobium excrementavium TaxID=2840668 RepID=A0A9D1K739_9FIRM|nr:sporulation transcriptional regulator SpoIIID [Candidatus Alectryocaccomicrobium excrementavium]